MEEDKIYDKLLDGNFSKIEKLAAGYRVEKNYNSMIVVAEIGSHGRVVSVGTKAAALAWVLGLITFPLGSLAIFVYMQTRKAERIASMQMQLQRILR
jgi:hypothetical protein